MTYRFAIPLIVLLLLASFAAPVTARQDDAGVVPVAIRIPRALVDTRIESLEVVDGVPASPSAVWAVGWYRESGRIGVPGNTVMFGHREWWKVGPAVFYYLNQVREGHSVDITGDDGKRYRYRIDSVQTYDRAAAPLQEIFGPTGEESLTLLSDAEPFDDATGYQGILVVRGTRKSTPPSTAPKETPALLDQPSGCPAPARTLNLPVAQAAFPEGDALTLRGAETADADAIAAIDALLDAASDCEIAVREALTLKDGAILALVGPPGDIPLEALTGITRIGAGDVTDLTLAQLCDFMLFIEETGEWRVIAPTWWFIEGDASGD